MTPGSESNAGEPDMRDDEHRLLAACLSGDQRAWESLVDRYGRLVFSVPRRYGLSPEACDDVFQSVFLIAFRELSSLRDGRSLTKWLITIAHHETGRWAARAARATGRSLPEIPDVAPGDLVERLERQQMVREALAELGGRCEELLIALFSGPERPDYAAVAARLKMPVGSLGPTRARCLEKMLRILGERGRV